MKTWIEYRLHYPGDDQPPDGLVVVTPHHCSAKDVRRWAEANYQDSWKRLYRQGFRVVRVRVRG